MSKDKLIKLLQKEISRFELRGTGIRSLVQDAIKLLEISNTRTTFPDGIQKDEYVEMLEDRILKLEEEVKNLSAPYNDAISLDRIMFKDAMYAPIYNTTGAAGRRG